jgi:hypothetical protein
MPCDAHPTVSATPTRSTPTLSTARYSVRRSTTSEWNESLDEKRTSSHLDLIKAMTSSAAAVMARHILAVGELAEKVGRADDDVSGLGLACFLWRW